MFVGHHSNRVIPREHTVTIASAMTHGLEKLRAKSKFGSLRKPKAQQRPTILSAFHDEGILEAPLEAPSSSSSAEAPPAPDDQSLFPPPSFIRPTTSRMIARTEASPSCKRVLPSLSGSEPERTADSSARSSCIASSPDSNSSASVHNTATGSAPPIPRRSSSLRKQQREHLSLASLIHYEFTERESKNAVRSLSSLCDSVRPKLDGAFDPSIITIANTDDISPASEREESCPPSPLTTVPVQPRVTHPTPGPSASLVAVSDSLLNTSRHIEDAVRRRPSLQFPTVRPVPLKQRCMSLGGNQPRYPVIRPCVSEPVLVEPAVREFLGLSDDDIAESLPLSSESSPQEGSTPCSTSVTESRMLEPSAPPRTPPSTQCGACDAVEDSPKTISPRVMPPSQQSIRRISTRLSTATNEDRAAAMAAFEVARIASRYHFDLIYLITLWPTQMTRRKPQSPFLTDVFDDSLRRRPASAADTSGTSTCSSLREFPSASSGGASSADAADTTAASSVGGDQALATATTWCGSGEAGLSYRFLAAYGLHTVKAPLQISYAVHSKILQTDGWIEYRETDPGEGAFARGYASSFYTGYAPAYDDDARRPSVDALPMGDERTSGVSAVAQGKLPEHAEPERTSGGRLKSEHNRGIVFAAYRKPRADGQDLSLTLSERMDMQQDVEALVDMIIECHKVNRRHDRHKREKSMSSFGRAAGGRRGESLSRSRHAGLPAAAECGSGTDSSADGVRGRSSI